MTIVPLEVIHNLLLGVKPISKLMQRYHLTGINSNSGKVQEVYTLYSRFTPPRGKDVLEIGPGQTLDVLETALTAGAVSCTAVDVLRYVSEKQTKKTQIDYILYDGRRLPFNSCEFDCIWSHTAFEHVRDPATTVAECFRVLRHGGHLVALIDLGDHSYYGLQPPQPLKLFDCLRYPEWLWNLMKWNRSSYTNRLRKSDWIRLFTEAGFVIEHQESTVSDVVVKALPSLPYLQRYSYEDAVTNVITLWLRKPQA
ncbi:MAG: class I SAM-dependent methyltransferase [Nitrospira sp.]|nr:class I SAM-dependent methyltransferase [Nitrospira sp.]MDH4302493.1 class I SAM-dependent methyltransferase [Nitrospira sp.]MDH5192221.1 class I SAM-dependent methyltransferase [Nitrospira sp.]